jgi:thiamine-phosphate diphosphorylase
MSKSTPLFLISDGGALRSKSLLIETIEECLVSAQGRISHLLLREQVVGSGSEPASDDEVLELISQIKAIASCCDCKVLLHTRVDLALLAGVAGVHVGGYGASVAEVRAQLGASAIVGFSAHSESDVIAAIDMGADYVFLSPIFPPTSKPRSRPILGTSELARICSMSSIPIFALGGVTAETIGSCRDAGAAGAAVIGYVFGSGQAGDRVNDLLCAWDS